MSRNINREGIEAEIAELEHLGLDALRARWQEITGKPAPKFFRRKFLMRAVAYQIQVKAYGGIAKAVQRRLRKVADDVRAGKPVAMSSPRPIKAGTRLVRAWGGHVHTVTVIGEAYEYEGERYTSLSAIARKITGTSWSGPQFFGLKDRTQIGQNGQGGHPPDQVHTSPKITTCTDEPVRMRKHCEPETFDA